MEGKSDAEKSNNCAGHAGHLSGVLAERNVSRPVLGGEGQRTQLGSTVDWSRRSVVAQERQKKEQQNGQGKQGNQGATTNS